MSVTDENSSGVWLRPSRLRTKIIATGAIAAICCEFMAGSARHDVRGHSLGGGGRLERRNQERIGKARLLVEHHFDGDIEFAAGDDFAQKPFMRGVESPPRGGVGVARVDHKGDFRWNDAGKIRLDHSAAHSGDRWPPHAMRGVDHTACDFRESRHRIATDVHGKGASVILELRAVRPHSGECQ